MFDRTALEMVPEENPISAYTLRKMAMRLRKTRRLQPELVLPVADWNRRIITLAAQPIRVHADIVPEGPGVYLSFAIAPGISMWASPPTCGND